MEEPLTEELLAELMSSPRAEDFLGAHTLDERLLSDYLNQLLAERGLERARVVAAAEINPTHGYQVFTGQRGAGRETVLKLAFAMGLSVRECGRLLRAANVAALTPKNRRDAIILYCLQHECTLQVANETLYHFGEETL